MANFEYPNSETLELFISLIKGGKHRISKYLPETDKDWFQAISDCIEYVNHTSGYQEGASIHEVGARILYKVTKRHELGDGNKRSAVISVYLFCIINNYTVIDPKKLKSLAKRIAKTKGRMNEDTIKKRIAKKLEEIIEYMGKN